MLDILGTLAGSLFSGLGAADAADATNKAGKEAQQLYQDQTNQAKVQQLFRVLGPQEATRQLRATLGADGYERMFGKPGASNAKRRELEGKIADLDNQLRTGALSGTQTQRQRAELNKQKQALQRERNNMPKAGAFDLEDFTQGFEGQGAINELDAIAKDSKVQGDKILTDYNAETARLGGLDQRDLLNLRQQNRRMMGEVDKYGQGREAQIQREYQTQLKDQNDQATAQLVNSGLGASTLLTNATGANARRLGWNKNDAQQQLADQRLGAKTGAMTWGFDRESGQANQIASRNYGRSQGGTQLAGDLLARNSALGAVAPQAKMNFFTSPAFNPYLNVNTTQFFPGASPQAAFSQNVGNGLAGMGSSMLFANSGRNQSQPPNQFNPRGYNWFKENPGL
jgi:hypothetical protein